MTCPSLLLFDLGGVLVDSSVFEHLNRLLPESRLGQDVKERWLLSPSVRQFERGEISADDFAKRFVAEWGLELTPGAFLKAFSAWPRHFFPGARETIQRLRESYKVGCLSNSNPLHCTQFDGVEALFDICLFSHLIGAVKPDREIFVLAIGKCDVDPADIYFFDDCMANVRAAQSIGMNAYCVDGFSSVQKWLSLEGLLPKTH